MTRALALLDAFEQAESSYSVAALARRVGLPRTTTLRMIDTLVDEGMLLIGDDGGVRAGTRLIRWGALAAAAWTVPPATLERLREVSDETGETVSIYIRNGLHRTVIAQVQSRHTLRHVVQTGDELPLWGGAAAMVLLGMEPESTRSALIDDVVRASEGRTTSELLTEAVARAVREGYAVSHGGREPGNSGLAVPLPTTQPTSARIHVPVGIALGGPTVRFSSDRVPDFLAILRAAAVDITTTGLPAALY